MSYNSDLDRITEAEIVPDFVERLTLGRDLKVNSISVGGSATDNGFVKGKKLTDVIGTIAFAALPYKVRKLLYESKSVYMIQIIVSSDDWKTISFSMANSNADNMKIIYAMTDQFRSDISSVFTKSSNGVSFTISAEFDTPIPKNTAFTIFVG